jgi:hypothetical protein
MFQASPSPNDGKANGLRKKSEKTITPMQVFRKTIPSLPTLFWICGMLILGGALIPESSQGQELSATPYRPTVSNPAQLPVPGYLELESGWQTIKRGDERERHSVPYLLKLAFNDRVGLLVGGDAFISRVNSEEPTVTGFGDMSAFLKFQHPIRELGAVGLELGVKLPTAPSTVGTTKTDYIANIIYSGPIGPMMVDLNLLYARLGDTAGGIGRNQLGWVVTASKALSDTWGVAGEFAGFHREGVKPFSQFLVAANYAWTPRIVLDAGMAFGLTAASQDWTAFTGLTMLLGKIL